MKEGNRLTYLAVAFQVGLAALNVPFFTNPLNIAAALFCLINAGICWRLTAK